MERIKILITIFALFFVFSIIAIAFKYVLMFIYGLSSILFEGITILYNNNILFITIGIIICYIRFSESYLAIGTVMISCLAITFFERNLRKWITGKVNKVGFIKRIKIQNDINLMKKYSIEIPTDMKENYIAKGFRI